MTTIAATSPVRPARVSRLVRATLFAAALALAGTAFGHTAIARAEWDIEEYDNCMASIENDAQYCCDISGGVWKKTTGGMCVAPVEIGNLQGGQGTSTPTRVQPPIAVAPPATAVNPGVETSRYPVPPVMAPLRPR